MIYTVKRGDTLYNIADRYGVGMGDLAALNQLSEPARLAVGTALVIPDEEPLPMRNVIVNGYAVSGISDTALMGALPYLTYISLFSVRAQADGSLVPMNDAALIRRAYRSGTAPLMTLTNESEGKGFSSSVAHAVLREPEAKTALIDNIMTYLDSRDYYGINVDFEYIPPEDREAYSGFLNELNDRLKRVGYHLSVAVAPKVSAEQEGLLYTAHDYEAIGAIADNVMIMTYEWGYLYGEPMPVAPIGPVEEVVQYAVSAMPAEKILLGMANYGYNWTLPWKKGDAANTLRLADAPKLAYDVRGEIRFDEASASPSISYYDSAGREHIAWFEDARSIERKFELVENYGLGGLSYWNINNLYRPNWALLADTFGIEKVRFGG